MTLDAGTYRVEWFSVEGRETAEADDVSVNGSTSITLSAPFEDAAVLHLKRVGTAPGRS